VVDISLQMDGGLVLKRGIDISNNLDLSGEDN